MPSKLSRREFLARTAASTAAAAAVSRAPVVFAAPQGSPNDRLQLGIIGVGARVQSGLLDAALGVSGVELVGVCDAYKGRVQRAIARSGGRAKDYGDWKALLADKSVDAVIIGTPDHWHRVQTVEPLRAGKHVYLEKPMTLTIEDGPEMIAAAKASGRVLQIGSQGISSKTQETARDLIKAGKLGQVTMIRASYNRYKETHEVPDTVNAVLEYPEGFAVNLSSTFNNQASAESGFEVLGTEGSLVFRGGQMVLKPETAVEDNGWVVTSWPEGLEKAYYADPKVLASERPDTWTPQMRRESEAFGEIGREATAVHMARFFESARTGKPAFEDGQRGHFAAAAAHLVNLSIRQRRPLEWNFTSGQPT